MEKALNKAHLSKILKYGKIVAAFVCISMIILNFFNPILLYQPSVYSINEKISSVMDLVAASTAASAVISMIPDDTATPIAEQLAELSKYFILVLGALYLEKFLIPIFSWISPMMMLAAVLMLGKKINGLISRNQSKRIAALLCALSVVFSIMIPISIFISDSISKVYEDSVSEPIKTALAVEEAIEDGEEKEKNVWEIITKAAQKVVSSVSGAIEWAKTVLNHFVQAVGIILVTHCIIPVLTVISLFIIVKFSMKASFFSNKEQYLSNHKSANDGLKNLDEKTVY